MKKKLAILCILCCALPSISRAQGTDNDLETGFGARVSVSADKKIVKGLHVVADAEVRTTDYINELGRYQAGIGVTYKISDFLKVGAGYMFIEKKNSSEVWNPRNRFYGDATLSYKTGPWKLSLKERLQLTCREVNNPYQDTPNLLALKSRVKAAYKATASLTPYAYVEARNVFNDPSCSAVWSTSSQKYSDYVFDGYKHAYFNRFRGSLGLEWEFGMHHALDFYLLADYCHDKNVDVNKDGTKLKSLTWDRTFLTSFGIGYTFSF